MPLDDQLLIERSKRGDRQAFEELVKLYETKVYNVAYRVMGNHADACDLAQEAFIKIYQALPGFRGDASFNTWLYHITVNVCRDELRRRQRRQVVYIDETSGNGPSVLETADNPVPTPEEELERSQTKELVQECLNQLSDDYRMILVMREMQDLSYDEIAKILDCSLGTVKSRLSRARQAFKEKISKHTELFIHKDRLAK